MNAFSTALTPILTLILVGYGLKRVGFMPDVAWEGMEKLTYFVLFPALLINTLGPQTVSGTPWLALMLISCGTLLVAASILIVYFLFRSGMRPATFTSIFQGGMRFNTYITFSIAQALFGITGLILSSVMAGFMIVLINLLCIAIFAVWGKAELRGIMPFVRAIILNPLILASAIGWTLSLSGIGLPGISKDIFHIIGRAALPFGLLAVGAALQPGSVYGHAKSIALATTVQFGIKPLTAATLIQMYGISGSTAAVLILAFITPTASASYILARQLGGDTETMASIITFQTLLAFLAMPLLAHFLLRFN